MKLKFTRCALLSGVALCFAGILTAQGSSTIITFSVDMATNLANGTFNPPPPAGTGTDAVYVFGTFNGWSGPGLQLVQAGNSTVYTNTYDDTRDANGLVVSYRFNINGNNESTACWDNRAAHLPATSGASLVLPTPYYGDVGPGQVINVTFQVDMSEEIQLGHFTPGVDQVDVRGSFNGWGNSGAYLTNDPSISVTNAGGLVTSNVYTLTVPITSGAQVPGIPATNAMMEWKAVEDPSGSWESPGPANADDAGNRFWCNNTNQVLPLVSFSDLPFAPLAYATLNVDMSGVVKYDPNFVPGTVSVWGTFNNWAAGIPMTNNPAAVNTNLYSAVVTMAEGASILYQFRYTNSAVGGWVYDYMDDKVYNDSARRTVTMPITATALHTNMPTVYFLDLALSDYLPQATPVFFAVDMNGAVGTDAYVFTPGTDAVYINGMFANSGGYPQAWYPWTTQFNPAPPGYQMIRMGSTTIYTNTIVLPAGTPIAVSYQYGMDPGSLYGGPQEDEAPAGSNHYRVVRSTAMSPYTMATDKFGFQYAEPIFSTGNIGGFGSPADAQLTVGTPVAGKVPVSWLGRPGAHLQMSTGSANSAWQDLLATDGTTWASGNSSTNGLVSVTNVTVTGNALFRVVKP